MAWGCEGHVGVRTGCRECGKIHLLQRTIHWQSGANRKINVRVP